MDIKIEIIELMIKRMTLKKILMKHFLILIKD